ncbi:sulfite exporter TauE/SafE family protein [Skermania sp. ID1734]|uniref:sulfite exporter TauE/SafE family protein n=1 Tax=Skermania sp. ID1734 TaxID=2597516 RepID=UPI0011811AB1|nr:sulfite exporter TauE/SafE family protein [Skermania sp. ID1734]TSD94884.1 sulfite exporter TauE/SafE family protein [Skermania sp. ID1734]
MTILVTLVLGTVIGILLGLLGGGGSILAVPGLVYGLGIPLEQAVPMSLLVVGIASLFGAVPKIRAHQVQWRVAGVFAVTGFLAAFAGSAVNRLLPPAVTLAGFAAVMIASGIRMLSSTEGTGTACRAEGSAVNWRRCTSRAVPAGLGVGFLTGLFGVGGGFLIIPALVLLLGIEMSVAVGTSLVIVTANSGSGLLAYLGNLSLDWGLVVVFTATAIGGSLVAGRYGKKVDTARLQKWFAYLIFAVAAFVLVEVIFVR